MQQLPVSQNVEGSYTLHFTTNLMNGKHIMYTQIQ